MAKKKTRVLLPGGIQGLVHDLQNGTSQFAPKPLNTDNLDTDDVDEVEQEDVKKAEPQQVVEQEQSADQRYDSVDAHARQMQQAEEPAATKREDVAPEAPAMVSEQPAGHAAESGVGESGEANGPGRRPKEHTMKEYHIVKDNSQDSWQLFIDMAQQYKQGGGKLATIYIDESLKGVLDRMKYAGPEKLSTSAILSSIVARFIYDHEDEIRHVLFDGKLI